MRSLVLGGSQFIGRHLVAELLHRGHEVAVLNRGQTPASFPPPVRRLLADRTRPDDLRAALAGQEFDAVFDVSAYTVDMLRPTVEALDGRVGRYVFTSTTAVYRPADTLPITEDQPLHADSPRRYAVDKIACEAYLAERWRRDRFPATVLRPPLVIGPHNNVAGREQTFFARLRRKRPQLVPGDGLTVLHFVQVEDLARAFADCIQGGATLGQAYTIAGRDAVTHLGYTRLAGEIVGMAPRVLHVPADRVDAARPFYCPFDWQHSAVYSWEKARRDFGWEPRRDTRSALSHAYAWYLRMGLDDGPWDFSREDALLRELGAGA